MSHRFVITDIHGCAATFKTLLDQLDLQHDDTLYLLGDYIDRGPNSKGVLDIIMQLSASGFNVQALMGNHESMLLKSLSCFEAKCRWLTNGGNFTLKSFNVKQPGDIPQEYLDFIAALQKVIVIDDYVLAHAGLHFGVPDPVKDTPDFFLFWERDNKVVPELIGGRTLVVGHTRKDLHQIRQSLETYCITLDNGCFDMRNTGFGSLIALDLDKREILIQPNCEPECSRTE